MKSVLSLLAAVGLVAAAPVSQPEQAISNSTIEARASGWWYSNIDHSSGAVRAYDPELGNDYTYQVYKAINPGDSISDAIASGGPNGNRDNGWSFNEPRVVFLNPGTYTLSQTLYMFTDTIIVSDPNNPATIKASSGFNGDYMIVGGQDGDGNGGELKFSTGIKNVILDTTANSGDSSFTALSWRVAQNAYLENIVINMPQGAHTGIWMGQGSTISVADVTFNYGSTGFHYAGHQQAQLKGFTFNKCTTGLAVDGGNTITLYAPSFDTNGYPIQYNSGSSFLSIIDATSTNSGTFLTINNRGDGGILIENLSNQNQNNPVVKSGGNTLLGATSHVDSWIIGNIYSGGSAKFVNGQTSQNGRPTSLAPNGKYPLGKAPSYASFTASQVVNVKDSNANGGYTVKGDGNNDDTAGLNSALKIAASAGKIAFLPYGIYRVTDSIYVPSGSRVVGEGWSTITGYGSKFSDSSNPYPVVKIGNSGEVGTAELQELRFSVQQSLPGAIIVQVNMAGRSNPTDVAIYNSLITVGGTRESQINCGDEYDNGCQGAYLGLHLTSSSSAYIDNLWAWVADHPSDGSSGGIHTTPKGGILVEATKGTWLVGVGSEHWWLYNLNFHNAQNVLVSFFQSETNYFEQMPNHDAPTVPAPWTPVSGTDPDFSWCNGAAATCYHGVGEYFNGGKNIYHYGAGSYNFNNAEQATMNVVAAYPQNFQLWGLTTHAANYALRLPDGTRIGKDGGGDGFPGAWGADIAAYRDHAQSSPA